MKGMAVGIAPAQLPWRRAGAWLAFLGPFFFASYGLATLLTAQRAEVPAIVFGWEHHIPFVPWTIAPYWSIDFLYGLSLFVCTDRDELDTHAKRLLTAQIVAIFCFVALPLKFSFVRPDVEGAFGWMFRVLSSFDQPFNQAPSLHIALLVILWALYARKFGTVGRVVLHVGFTLIGVSVLTTWQHHFIDLPTGALLGFFCMWLWPLGRPMPFAATQWTRSGARSRLAACYALGAALAVTVATLVGGVALWLLWIAIALAIVALNYARLGASGFQKRDGALSPAATVLLAPYLIGARVNARAWTHHRPHADHVADGVHIGRLPSVADLERNRFVAVVDLACELSVDASADAPTPTCPC